MTINLEDVFKTSGVPTHTFVEPKEYTKLLVALRTPGRGVVVEGPSGIGKTSAVENALKVIEEQKTIHKLSARRPEDVEYINALPTLGAKGVIIVDDFHRLDDTTKSRLADFLKTLADESRSDIKVIIIGINRAGERLITFASDLVNRIEVIVFENNPENKIEELISRGETALNVELNVRKEIVDAAQGSFYITQLLCHEVCIAAAVLSRQQQQTATKVSFEAIRAAVWDRLERRFREPCKIFCQGPRMKRTGRAPYLHVLHWLAVGAEWTLHVLDATRKEPTLRESVVQVVQKGYLRDLIDDNPSVREVLHYDETGKTLTVEDPQFVFFLKYLPWSSFAKEIGFVSVEFRQRYDFALSFAGSDRDVAEALAESLSDEEVAVFYDKFEQHRILAQDVEEYLRPIYQSEASFVVALLGPDYPKRIWTKFESDVFKERFKTGAVIPIWFDTAPRGMFDESTKVGGFELSRSVEMAPQVKTLTELLMKKLEDKRSQESGPALPAEGPESLPSA